jgi:hypothetical protein
VILLYLTAIVLANLTVAWWGPGWSIVNAFLFIGLDLTARDNLHDRWHNRGLVWKMALLIASGGLVSYLLNADAGIIAIASTAAFTAAATVDGIFYHWLREKPWMVRVNSSNVPAAAVDSLIFPTIAFGGLLIWVTLGQFVAKVAGGFLWSLVLRDKK